MFAVDLLDNQTLLPIDSKWYVRLAKYVLREEEVKRAQVAVLFVDNREIWKINKKHLQHDYPTDVITFPLSESTTKIDGQLVISTEFAIETCEEYGWSATMEASLYLVHGLLHLCGYDDRDDRSREKMEARQQQLLEDFAKCNQYTTEPSLDQQPSQSDLSEISETGNSERLSGVHHPPDPDGEDPPNPVTGGISQTS